MSITFVKIKLSLISGKMQSIHLYSFPQNRFYGIGFSQRPPAIAGVKMYYLRNAMRSSNVPSRRNNRYATHRFISFFKNTNPRNFSCRCSETSDNSHNVRFWQLNNVSTWPWEVPGVRTATFNTSVVAPSSLLNWLMAWTIVTISSSISRKEIMVILS